MKLETSVFETEYTDWLESPTGQKTLDIFRVHEIEPEMLESIAHIWWLYGERSGLNFQRDYPRL